MSKIVNLTPHDVVIMNDEKESVRVYPASGTVARVQSRSETIGDLDGIPVVKATWGEVEGLPEPQEGTVYIVSMLVGQCVSGSRKDVVGPDTSPGSVIRNENGQIIGVKQFQVF